MKTGELTGAALDWAVANCEEADISVFGCHVALWISKDSNIDYEPSTDWAQGGPIIEREIAKVERFSDALWEATAYTKDAQDIVQNGPNPLVAAMRCYVASKLGDEVEVPEELKGVTA